MHRLMARSLRRNRVTLLTYSSLFLALWMAAAPGVALARTSTSTKEFSRAAYLYAQDSSLQEIIEEFQQAIIDSVYREFYGSIVNSDRQNNADGAIKAYEQAIEANPNSIQSYISLGILYSQTGNYKRALLTYLPALALEPNNPDIYAALGFTYIQSGQYEEAIDFLQKAARLAPNQANIQLLLRTALLRQRDMGN